MPVRPRRLVGVLALGVLPAACGGGGGTGACGEFADVQRALQAATVDGTPARLREVSNGLAALAASSSGSLQAAAETARRNWTAYERATSAETRNEFAVHQAYLDAQAPLAAFTAACGSAL